MMVPATRVDPTKMAVQLEFAQNPVCSQHSNVCETLQGCAYVITYS